MNSSKLPPEVSIIIVNSSNFSIDALTSVLITKIASGQRPHVACLKQEELHQASNLKVFIKTCIDERLENRRIILEKSKQIKDFNQLDEWKKEAESIKSRKGKEQSSSRGIKDGIRNQSTAMKRDCAQNAIIDFPLEYESIKLYLILFDVYDLKLIKALASLDSSLKTIVNLYPRDAHNEGDPIRNEEFWEKLLAEKSTEAFKDVAFIDLDVPVESHYIVNLRSKLVYDQFCHFFYDIENVKSSYKTFCERFDIVEINVESVASVDDLDGVKRRLDQIPESLITVEVIYGAILDQIANDEKETRKSSLKRQFPFQVEVVGKVFTDLNDAWGGVFEESPSFYSEQIEKLADALHMWDGVETIPLEKRQLLNHFMGKLLKALEAECEGFEHLEFYIYALQFSAMEKVSGVSEETSTVKEFYENRSVGREKQPTLIKTSVSDSHIDYNNQSKIPIEISQLVPDKEKFQAVQIGRAGLQVHMFSPPAMIQHLTCLLESSTAYTRQHCQLFDVMLIKFHKRPIPEMFSSRTFRKVLPTPLCFRDFNDFEKPHLKLETTENEEKSFREGDSFLTQVKPEDFFLKHSMKLQKKVQEACESDSKPETEMKEMTQAPRVQKAKDDVKKDLRVFNVSNRRIQFDSTESEFNSVHLQVKASTFEWLNHLRVLNVSCQMYDVFLSISHDLNANNLQLVTLNNSDGMKCSLETSPNESDPNVTDGSQRLLNRWIFSISHSNGCSIKNLNDEAVEQYWVEEKKSPDGEAKRVVFSNGFVMIVFVDGAQRVLSPNGTIFEVNPKSRRSEEAPKNFPNREHDKESTNLHLDSITSIHFLKNFTDPLTSFKLTLPKGEKFLVENDLIVQKLESIELREIFNQTTGSLHICRDDGVKTLHTEAFTKCLFPDGTLITTRLHDNSIETAIDDVEDINEPILDRIWSTESKNESKFVVHQILNHIADDYFLYINSDHQVEHKNYGAVRFDRKKSVYIDNCGMKIQVHSDNILMTMNDGVTLKIDESNIHLTGEKCNECASSNGLEVNFLDESESGNEVFISARDFAANTFVIRKNGQHASYRSETYETKKCQSCEGVKRKYELMRYGERCVIVNRDISGYEMASSAVTKNLKPFLETPNELLFNKPSCDFEVSDKDVKIDIDPKITMLSIMEETYSSPSILSEKSESLLANVTSRKPMKNSKTTKTKKRKSTRKMSQESKIIQPPIEEGNFPQWLTENPSISPDISNELRNLIQFHDNPLNELPVSSAVGPMIKLNNKFNNVTDAVQHLKKYSSEKFIFNVNGLEQMPLGKKSFEENFKLVVRNTIENHIQQKLECHRRCLAALVINDLLENAISASETVRSDIETLCDETNVVQIENSAVSTPPVAVKAFSFS